MKLNFLINDSNNKFIKFKISFIYYTSLIFLSTIVKILFYVLIVKFI